MADDLTADCIGGGHAYVCHGQQCVMIAYTQEVGWWRNSAWFTPAAARSLAAALVRQADAAEVPEPSDDAARPEGDGGKATR